MGVRVTLRETGSLVEQGDVNALAGAIGRIPADYTKREGAKPMVNKALTNGSPLHKGYVVLQRLMSNVSNWPFLAYCCLGILLFPLYQFQIDPDGISYMNIAHLYASGDVHDAINGYWQPLISWLLVPFLLLRFQPLFASKLLSLIISFFTLIAIRKLSYRFALNERVRLCISLAAVPMLLSFTFWGMPGADLLFLCISLYYLYYIFDADYSGNAIHGFMIGFLGALLFLSKSYGFYFFIFHFSFFTLIYYLISKTRQKRGKVLLKYIFGLTIFLIISGIWIYSISNKYQHFTISNSGEHNMQLDSPGSRGQPMLYQGLLPLPYPTAVSAWDDPSYLTIEYDKSAGLFNWIRFQIVHIGGNLIQTLGYFELFSIFSIIIIVIYAIRYFGKRFRKAEEGIQSLEARSWRTWLQYDGSRDDGKLRSITLYALITMLLYTAGYELLHIEVSYLWIDAILLLLLCANYVSDNDFDFMRSMKRQRVLVYLIFLSFWLYPVMLLTIRVNQYRDIYTTSKQLQTAYHLRGNIASNNDGDATNSWGLALFYTYFLDSKYYGITQENITDEDLQRELGKNHIDYYFVWNGTCRLSQCRKIAEFEVRFLWWYETKHLVVYQIKNNSS